MIGTGYLGGVYPGGGQQDQGEPPEFIVYEYDGNCAALACSLESTSRHGRRPVRSTHTYLPPPESSPGAFKLPQWVGPHVFEPVTALRAPAVRLMAETEFYKCEEADELLLLFALAYGEPEGMYANT
jgi:hypothetical protein